MSQNLEEELVQTYDTRLQDLVEQYDLSSLPDAAHLHVRLAQNPHYSWWLLSYNNEKRSSRSGVITMYLNDSLFDDLVDLPGATEIDFSQPYFETEVGYGATKNHFLTQDFSYVERAILAELDRHGFPRK